MTNLIALKIFLFFYLPLFNSVAKNIFLGIYIYIGEIFASPSPPCIPQVTPMRRQQAETNRVQQNSSAILV